MAEGTGYLIVTGVVWAALILLVMVAAAGLLYRPPRTGHVRRSLLPPEERDDAPPVRTSYDPARLPAPADEHGNGDYRPYTTVPETHKLPRTPETHDKAQRVEPDWAAMFPDWSDEELEDMIEVPLSASEGEEGET